jgi:hypothetical protein
MDNGTHDDEIVLRPGDIMVVRRKGYSIEYTGALVNLQDGAGLTLVSLISFNELTICHDLIEPDDADMDDVRTWLAANNLELVAYYDVNHCSVDITVSTGAQDREGLV